VREEWQSVLTIEGLMRSGQVQLDESKFYKNWRALIGRSANEPSPNTAVENTTLSLNLLDNSH